MNLGEKIKKLRLEKGLSQDELGKAMGVHYTHISRYERNQSNPSIDALRKLAKVFGVSADYLLFDDLDKVALGNVHDSDLRQQFQDLDRLSDTVREKVKFLIQAILTQQQVQDLASKMGPKELSASERG